MPLVAVPNRIEISDFSKGWMPDQEPSQVPQDGLLDVSNLLLNPGSGSLELRRGYKRITSAMQQGYTIQSLHAYNRLAGDTTGQYLIVVMTTKVDATPGNVVVYAVNLVSGVETMISPNDGAATPVPTKAWESGDGRHWGATIQETFYGGGTGDPMYSWNPDDGWNDEVAVPDEPELVDSTTPATDQRASDYAFKLGDRVLFRDPTGTPTQPTVALLTAASDTTNGSSFTTASITPGNNKLILMAVLSTKASGGGPAQKPKVSGAGLTFVEIKDVNFDTIATPTKRLTVFRAMKAAPGSGALTISYNQNQAGVSWAVLEVSAMDTTGNNGAGAVATARVKTARTDGATSLAVTMNTPVDSSSMVGFFARGNNEVMAPGAGYTELSDTGHATPDARLQSEAQASESTTVDSSWSTSGPAAGIGIEVFAGGTGGLLLFEVEARRQNDDLRFKTWKANKKYERARDYVSRKADPAAESEYWRSYRCIKTHESGPQNRPGDGTGGWQAYWRQVSLDLPMDTDGDVSDDWNLIPTAPQTHIAVWHSERLFMRYDDVEEQMGLSRVAYSAPSKFKKGSDITTLEWDPTNFGIGETKADGDGGGFFDVRTGDGDPITAMRSSGGYLFIFKRKTTHVLVGTGKQDFDLRFLGPAGAVSHRATAELGGFVYFIGDQGLYFTDGTQAVPVPGFVKVREWLREAIDWTDPNIDITMWAYDNKIWIALPTTQGRNADMVLVYDPLTESFWPLDMEVSAVAINRKDGIEQMFFAGETLVGTHSGAAMAWSGDNHGSASTRTISAVVETNLLSDPSFEPRRLTPFVSELNAFDWQTLAEAKARTTWRRTDTTYVKIDRTTGARLRGKTGMVVEFDRDPYVFDAVESPNRARPPLIEVDFEGVYENIADVDGTSHTMSVFIRRKNWEKNKTVNYNIARVRIAGSELAEGDHTYTYIGRGWYRMSATYTGSASVREHAIVIAPRKTVSLDKAMVTKGALVPYFDGDGTDGASTQYTITGGEYAMVFQYDHPDVRHQPFDDRGGATYENDVIAWGVRTTWLPFGTARQERRIRRMWALVRGLVNVVLSGFRNYKDSEPQFSVEVYPQDPNLPVTYFEGRTMEASYSVSFSIEGLGGPVSILGVAADTEHVRTRFTRG